MRIPRTGGAISGLLIVALGAWSAIVPFIGPSFNLTIGPDATFHMTDGRLWLSLLPGVVAVVGGLLVLFSTHRAQAILGAQLALAAGVWFVIGPVLSQLWSSAPGALGQAGFAAGDEGRRALEAIAYFYGVGAAITALAGVALGRPALRSARGGARPGGRGGARRAGGADGAAGPPAPRAGPRRARARARAGDRRRTGRASGARTGHDGH